MTGIRYLVGLLILALLSGVAYFLYPRQPALCEVCLRPLHRATFYKIHLSHDEVKEVCCPRCGLYFQQVRNDIVATEVADFKTGELLDTSKAVYIENSSVHLCYSANLVSRDVGGTEYALRWDRCLPSLVAFKSREDAQAFRSDKGGVLKTYHQLIEQKF